MVKFIIIVFLLLIGGCYDAQPYRQPAPVAGCVDGRVVNVVRRELYYLEDSYYYPLDHNGRYIKCEIVRKPKINYN